MKLSAVRLGQQFRVEGHTYELVKRNPCSATVREIGAKREVVFGEGEKERRILVDASRTVRIATTSEIDKVLG